MNIKELCKLINKVSKDRSVEEEFLHIYSETVKQLAKNRKPSQTYHPSSIGGCLRNVYYQIVGKDLDNNTKSPELIEIAESGSSRHEKIQERISKMRSIGFEVDWVSIEKHLENRKELGSTVIKDENNKDSLETLVYNNIYNMRFKCDGLIRFKGVLYILEIKTESSQKWRNRTAPEMSHKHQACCYSMALGVPKILFLYENRDFCSKKAYEFIPTDDELDSVSSIISICDEHVAKNEVPDKVSSNGCNYCNYKSSCRGDR